VPSTCLDAQASGVDNTDQAASWSLQCTGDVGNKQRGISVMMGWGDSIFLLSKAFLIRELKWLGRGRALQARECLQEAQGKVHLTWLRTS
jgi:hypothetical protein